MTDTIETLGSSLIQHGPHNDRIYLMKLADADMPGLVEQLLERARAAGYGKIFAKLPLHDRQEFLRVGFRQEGEIPGFYQGRESAAFLSYYLKSERQLEQQPQQLRDNLQLAEQKGAEPPGLVDLDPGLTCRVAGPGDVEVMAALYRQVFASYPFPIHDPEYLRQTMEENLVYFGVWEGDELLALSSAEMDAAAGNAEMTDFATLPACRGRGIAQFLLQEMEAEMARRKIRTLYTIARAYSPGMNITFAKHGYRFGGTLTNNTNISGSLESMNLWFKAL